MSTTARVKRPVVALVVGMLVAMGSVLSVAAPAAAADTWRVSSSSTSCFSYSFGRMCTTRTTSIRQVNYCTRPPISNPWASMAWASYCVRYTETNRFV